MTHASVLSAFGPKCPVVDPNVWLAPRSVVIGDVRLGRGSSVWYGAVLRAELDSITIGAGTNLQDNTVVHVDEGAPAEIGADVSVGHGAVLHGCHVGSSSVVGMNATILNHARIGAGSVIGAGSLILEGVEYPEYSLIIGAPARLRRRLTDAEVERNLAQASLYVELALQHRVALAGAGPDA